MNITHDPTPNQWNNVVRHCDYPHINQSWEWGEAYKAVPHIQPIRLLVLHNDEPVGTLQGFEWRIGHISLAMISGGTGGGGGPVVSSHLPELLKISVHEHLIRSFFKEAKRRRTLKTTLYTEMFAPQPIRENEWTVTPQWNPVAKLLSDPQTMLHERIDQKTRNQIVKAQKNGICVRKGTKSDLALYHSMQEDLARKKNLPFNHLNSLHNLQLLWETLTPKGMLKLWIAKKEQEIVGGAIIFYYQKGLLYQSGVTTQNGRDWYASNAIQWHVIQDAIQHGYTFYNLGGGTKDPQDLRFSITQFKMGFGGEFMEFHRYSAHGNRILRFLAYKTMKLFGRNEWFPLLVYP